MIERNGPKRTSLIARIGHSLNRPDRSGANRNVLVTLLKHRL